VDWARLLFLLIVLVIVFLFFLLLQKRLKPRLGRAYGLAGKIWTLEKWFLPSLSLLIILFKIKTMTRWLSGGETKDDVLEFLFIFFCMLIAFVGSGVMIIAAHVVDRGAPSD